MKILILFYCFSIFLFAQTDINTIVTDENSGKPMLVGYTTLDVFSDTTFWWYNAEYENYDVDTTVIEQFFISGDVDITIVMGTWCSDSRREVPRFIKILDYLGYPVNDIAIISVDRDKKGLEGEAADLNIELVPTFIFSVEGEELGRIIESPKESLEADMAEILE